MGYLKLTDSEIELIKKYQSTKDNEIALYFFNKMSKDLLDVIYSKINLKFTTLPFEKDDLMSIVWKCVKQGLLDYKKDGCTLFGIIENKSYLESLREIKKYFKNTHLVLSKAKSWDVYSQTHCIYKTTKNAVEYPKQSFSELLVPVVEFVASHNHTYNKTIIKRLLILKSMGFSEREIAEKMHISRRHVTSMIKVILRISKQYFKH